MCQAEVSVLLPVHHAGPGFVDAVLSIVRQIDIKPELVLVLNAPDQASKSAAFSLAAQFPEIKLVEEARKGIHFALNTGLAHCHAPFIARMDADDFSLPNRLRSQLNILLHHEQIDLVSCRTSVPESMQNGGFRAFVNWQNQILSPGQHLAAIFHESPVAHPSVMFRRNCLSRWGSYSFDHDIPEDYELWLRWLSRGARFLKIPEVLLIWNDSPQRLSRTHHAYSKVAFDKIRYPAAALFFKERKKEWWVCGGSRIAKRKILALRQNKLHIAGVIDVVQRKISGLPFVLATDFSPSEQQGVINLLSGREQIQHVSAFLNSLQLIEGEDWFTVG